MRKKKSIWANDRIEIVYYLVYIILSLYLRKTLFLLEPVPYSLIFVPILVGIFGLFVGIKSIKERKAGFHSITYRGKDAISVGTISIIVSIIIMFFVGT